MEILSKKVCLLTTIDRLRYGDGLFESMRVFNGKIFNRKSHENRIEKSLNILKLSLNKPISMVFDEVDDLLCINDVYKGGFARLCIIRDAQGNYMPSSNKRLIG